MLAAKPDISMEEAKEVHTSLRKAAGLVKFVQDSLLPQLQEKGTDGGDLDGRVCTAYINQVGDRRQEQCRTSPYNIRAAVFLSYNCELGLSKLVG